MSFPYEHIAEFTSALPQPLQPQSDLAVEFDNTFAELFVDRQRMEVDPLRSQTQRRA